MQPGPDEPTRSGVVVGVAIVLVIVLSTVAFLAFTRNDGASTPEQAVAEMVDAAQRGDLLGLMEQLPPGERHAVRDHAVDVGQQLQRLGLISSFDASAMDGVRPQFDALRTMTTEIAKDTTAVDIVSGTMTLPVAAGAGPPLTDAGRSFLEHAGVHVDEGNQTVTRDFEEEPFRVMTIREGGGWHVSLAYTLAEVIRKNADVELPDMGHGPPAVGGTTPAAAVEDLVRAYADGDPQRVLSLLYPDEARSVYDYAPAFLPDANDRAEAADRNHSYDVQVNSIETEPSGSGPTRTVRITALDMDIRDELKKTHVKYDGRCLHTDVRVRDGDEPYEKSDTCDRDWGTEDATQRTRNNPVANLAIFGGGNDFPTFVVVERQGRWYISPVQTLLGSFADTLATLPPDKLDVFADRLGASWKAGVGDGAGDGISGEPVKGDVGHEKPTLEEQAEADRAALIDACRTLTTGPRAAEVTRACWDHLVETKRADPADVPAA